ncbi:MAG TPA: guanylate kinase [Bacteroidales bacterium]|nr:guanylate kinase [Bacteroidales bacterium]
MNGKVLIFSAPSGAGKTTIVQHLLGIKDFNLSFSVSACSRPKRKNEINGKDYYFLSVDEFKAKIDNNEFLEWEQVYEGSFYGSLKSEVERLNAEGKNVVFDVDVKGGLNIKTHYGENALSVFVMPPSIEELEKRLLSRSTDNPEAIRIRVEKAKSEITFADRFDYVIVNDNLDNALAKAEKIVENFLK